MCGFVNAAWVNPYEMIVRREGEIICNVTAEIREKRSEIPSVAQEIAV